MIEFGNPDATPREDLQLGIAMLNDQDTVRAISLWQPWASACFHLVDGKPAKGIETRHWATAYRGPLVIHAAKCWTPDQRELAHREAIAGNLPVGLPRGALIGVVQLVMVAPTEELVGQISDRERGLGNYAPGRFGWILAAPRPFAKPIPWTGRQSFFSVPNEVISRAE